MKDCGLVRLNADVTQLRVTIVAHSAEDSGIFY